MSRNRAALGQLLEYEGYEVHTHANATDGIADYLKWRPHLVFLDVKMAGMDGMDALRSSVKLDPTATVVMISGHATIRTAVEATQAGAYEILEKPLEHRPHSRDAQECAVASRSPGRERTPQAVYRCAVRDRRQDAGNAAADGKDRESPRLPPPAFLITGENGTGKELVARALIACRRARPSRSSR